MLEALVLAAGKGTRMKSSLPKVLHPLFERPMLEYVLDTLRALGIRKPNVVVGAGASQVRSLLKDRVRYILQTEQKGTGHAAACAQKVFRGYRGDLLVWPADMPLVRRETLRRCIGRHRASGAAASVLSAVRENPAGYGRILKKGRRFYAIREERDSSPAQRRIREVNTGIYLFKAPRLFEALRRIRPANRKKEYYLTDVIEVLVREKHRVEALPLASSEEAQGINSRAHLSEAMKTVKKREVARHQRNGVTFLAADHVFIAPGVRIGRDTVIYPWTYIESGVKIGARCRIGPFAKLREGTVVGNDSVVGSFVEITRSRLGKKVLAKHLSYLGDAVIGDRSNIGAGTITANFDGERKHATRIGKKVLVGSDTVFVAPVTVGDGARTGAGAVITHGTKIKKGQILAGVPARPLRKGRG